MKTTGTDRSRRRSLGALACSALCTVAGATLGMRAARAAAPAFDLAALMRRMAERTSGEAAFTEERIVGGLDGPLAASGRLRFEAPDRFARQTLAPLVESMELRGRTLVLKRSGRTRTLDLDTVPEVGALLEALRATLTGDAALLARHFRTELSGGWGKWVLRLTPIDERLGKLVRQIELVGQNNDLRSIALAMANGDRSLMLIEPLQPLSPAAAPAGSTPAKAK